MNPDGEFTQVKSRGAKQKEKQQEKAQTHASQQATARLGLTTAGWQQNDYTMIKSIGKIRRFGNQANVPVHVTINLSDVDAFAAQTAGDPTAYVLAKSPYHVTVELSDEYRDDAKPCWYSASPGWSSKDAEVKSELATAADELKSDLASALKAAKTALGR